MLKIPKVFAIDSSNFPKHMANDYRRYADIPDCTIKHWPSGLDCLQFVRRANVTHVFCAETPYNKSLYSYAESFGVKVFLQINPEFFDGWKNPREPVPAKFLCPSYWYLDEMIERYGATKVQHLPPPTFPEDFVEARATNMQRSGRRRFLHIMGWVAAKDRNGTFTVLDALKHSKEDFELVIRCQHQCQEYVNYTNDPRIIWEVGNVLPQQNMYKDFDAMIYPRRFGGLALPMNEALMSALPVIMTDVSPNNKLLPPEWLIPSRVTDQLATKLLLDIYSADPVALAQRIDHFARMNDNALTEAKRQAYQIGYANFSNEVLLAQYEELLQ